MSYSPDNQSAYLATFEDLDRRLQAPHILVPKDKEDEYLDRYGLSARYWPNGVVRLAMSSKNGLKSSVNYTYASGSFRENPHHHGVTHFLEHRVASDAVHHASRSDVLLNAQTSPFDLAYYLTGVANRHVREYGVWQVFPVIHAALTGPDRLISKDFQAEQGVVIQEIRRRQGSFENNCWDAFEKVVVSPGHPLSYSSLGTEESVRSLTPQIVSEHATKVMIPEGLVISAITRGTRKSAKSVISIIDEFAESLPSSGRKPMRVILSEYGDVNPKFRNGEIYDIDISPLGFRNGLVMMYFVWLMDSTPWTLETFAQTSLLEAAAKKFSHRVRTTGTGYEDHLQNLGLRDKRIAGFSLLRSKDSDNAYRANKLVDELVMPALRDIDRSEAEHIKDLSVNRAQAVPPSRRTRFDDLVYGIREYGRIINSDVQAEIHKSVTAADLCAARDNLLSQRPAIVIVGDLS